MPSSSSSSSPCSDEKHTSADEELTPKASPAQADDEDADKTLTMPSTSQGYQPDCSPAHGRSAPSSQEATSPPTARRVESPPEQEFYYFTTDMANQAALDIEKEKEKFDSLITWYKLHREDVPALGTSSMGNSAAPSYVSEKGSTTPMSSQPSSHQSGTSSSGGALHAHNGFNYSPFGMDNNPSSNDPMQCMSSPVNLDDICPTLEDICTPRSSAMLPSTSSAPIPTAHDPLNLNFVNSNPPSNGSLKRKADDNSSEGPSKMAKIEEPGNREECPMRRLEMMANSQNFRTANTINEVVENNKKDERALKMEKLEGIEKSVGEEMAQQAREAHMKRMQQAAAASGYMSPGQFPPPMHHHQYPPQYPGMPPMPPPPHHPGMPPFSAGGFPPPFGAPMYPGLTPGGYPMSAPGKMPFGASPSFPMAPMAPRMPPHPSMMTPQQQQHLFHMQQMAAAQKAAMSPNMMARASPSPFPQNQAPNPAQYYHHMMMMRAQMQAGGPPPPMHMPPGAHEQQQQMMMMQNHPAQNPALLVAGNRGPMDPSAHMGGHPMGGAPMWQLTPHYPPPLPFSHGPPSGAPTPR